MKHRFLLAGMVALSVAGCSDPKFVGRPDLTLVDSSALPAPLDADLISPGRPYLIGPFDKLSVEVFGIQDLTRVVQADSSGRVSLPLAGVIEASGRTPTELAAIVADRLREYVRDPLVTVNLTETVSQLITVGGAVEAPGQFPVLGRMTLLRAITQAKGLSEFARANYVVVFRRVNNRDMAALFDIRAIEQGMYADPEVYANDVVMVGSSSARRIFKDALQGSSLLAAPLIALLQ